VTGRVEHALFDVASALQIPVLILALVAMAVVLLELGGFAIEVLRRRRRDFARLEEAVRSARAAVRVDRAALASEALRPVAASVAMGEALEALVAATGRPDSTPRMAKLLADFDYRSVRRLERTRMLVRAGPALGLMGTLIPLSPALAALARGDTKRLSDNLRVAFSVTVVGILVGTIAFVISLVRDRLYGQDLSDLQYVAAQLSAEER